MNFGRALRFMRVGYRVRRVGWQGWIDDQDPRWSLWATDVLACDWEIAGNVD